MQLMLNDDTILINIPLPARIENKLDVLESWMIKEQKYLWQGLAIILMIIKFSFIKMIL